MLDVWQGLAPGETTSHAGDIMPPRENETPPATRITNITSPQLEIYDPNPAERNGVVVLILPGGAYNYVVRDKEGSEAAEWLNRLGITGCVLRYRTKDGSNRPLWQRPVQDGQRAVSLVRSRAADWQLDPNKIGVLGFSAGGQAAALIATRFHQRAYEAGDEIDSASCRPDFALLLYPWQLVDNETGTLKSEFTVTAETPPTFLVHAHNDSHTSLSSVLLYVALQQQGVPAELHIYETGGHGSGLRPVAGSQFATWPSRAEDWLRARKIVGE
ncbi:MAG: alpha/beta hydrolase [Planctomycetaceae bacterium]